MSHVSSLLSQVRWLTMYPPPHRQLPWWDSQSAYIIHSILNSHCKKGKLEYLVDSEGYGSKEHYWVSPDYWFVSPVVYPHTLFKDFSFPCFFAKYMLCILFSRCYQAFWTLPWYPGFWPHICFWFLLFPQSLIFCSCLTWLLPVFGNWLTPSVLDVFALLPE